MGFYREEHSRTTARPCVPSVQLRTMCGTEVCPPTRRRLLPRSALLWCRAAALACVVFFLNVLSRCILPVSLAAPLYLPPDTDASTPDYKVEIDSTLITPSATGSIVQDYEALKAFYASTNGDNWTNNSNWDLTLAENAITPEKIGAFYGITSNGTRVSQIDMKNNNLTGTITDKIGDLRALSSFIVSNNFIGGTIPTTIGNLTDLRHFEASSNSLTGPIPSQIQNLTLLQTLQLNDNKLSGSIPSSLGQLSELRALFLNSNQLSGSIPSQLGSLSQAWLHEFEF